MTPAEVNESNQEYLRLNVYNKQQIFTRNKFNVGDKVRISRYKGVFSKGYEPNWSTEIFDVHKIHVTDPITYLIKDYQGNHIQGSFYEAELQKVKYPDTYLVEKIIREKDGKVYVKYLGFDSSHNSWINKKDLY
jgi:hypothetical protein